MLHTYGRRSRVLALVVLVALLLSSLPGVTTQAAGSPATATARTQQSTILAAGAVRLDFTVDGFVTAPGQDIYVVGSVAELGSWSPTSAVKLTWIDSDTWSGFVDFGASAGQTIQYKYIVRQGTSTTWENIANRSLTVPSAGSTSVHNVWNQAASTPPLPPLGAHIVTGGVKFTIFSQNATRAELSIFSSATASTPSSTHLLTRDSATNVWSVTVPNIGAGTYYGYRLWGPNWQYMAGWRPGTPKASDTGFRAHVDTAGNRFNPNKLLTDPYARAVSGEVTRVTTGTGTHYATGYLGGNDTYAFVDSAPVAPKSIVVDPTFDWTGDAKPNKPMKDSVIYEVHLRGYTRNDTIMTTSMRGTYSGFSAKAAHLKELGVTAVELLPVHEFPQFDDPLPGETADRIGYWGYITSQFFAPNREYLCTDMSACSYVSGQQVSAFKQMVKALHGQGIEVWLDVVYNHTAEVGVNTDSSVKYYNLRGIDNQNYYTLGDTRSTYFDTTGVGNNVNGSRPAARRLIIDSLKYWIDEMHVDGFRFDLAYELGREGNDGRDFNPNAQLLRDIAALGKTRGVKMVAEAWDTQGYGVGQFPDGWHEWNGKMRDTTRRFVKSNADQVGRLGTAITANEVGFGTPPESVNFVTAHDGFTLNDLVSYNTKQNGTGPCNPTGSDPNSGSNDNDSWDSGGDETLRRRQIRNFAAHLMVDQGVPMIVAGDEFRQTQYGNNNAYMADNTCGWLNWQNKTTHASTFQFFRKLIAFRKAHPALRRSVRFGETDSDGDGYRDLKWHGVWPDSPDWTSTSRTLAFLLDGSASETKGSADAPDIYVAHNAYWQDLTFNLPTAPNGKQWYILADTASWGESYGNIYYDPAIADWNQQRLPRVPGTSYGVQARSTIILLARPSGAAVP
ncbi:MAG TPA: carbohydrate-binding module family 20 domain-containing protein [Herpetosiphonaceae bacterium]